MHLFNWGLPASLPAKLSGFIISLGVFAHLISGAGSTNVQLPPKTQLVATVAATSTTTPKTVKPKVAFSAPKTPAKAPAPIKATIPTQKQTATKIVATPSTTTPAITSTSLSASAAASAPVAPPRVPDNAQVTASNQIIDTLSVQARSALVNIICTTQTGGSFAPISGSGVFVDSRGIILTNAHVAQYFLLKDYPFSNNIQCIIRSGSPAQPLYTAEVMYLPPAWVTANAAQLIATHALGTGENDYAFLHITGTVSATIALPTSFPSMSLAPTPPEVGAPVLVAAYPAQALDGASIVNSLYVSFAVSTVKTLFTFDNQQHVDLIAVGGTVVSQTGSSGGALVGLGSGKLLGLIATETTGDTPTDRQLNEISVGHIDRSLAAAGKGGFYSFLTGDLQQKVSDFQTNIAPGEIAQLEAVLNKGGSH